MQGGRQVPIEPDPRRSNDPTSRLYRIVPWVDPVADPHGVHPCSRYVELYWLPVVGPSTTWLLRRLSYGLEVHPGGFDLDLPRRPDHWGWASGWARTHRSAGPSSGSAPSSWPGPTGPTVWPSAPRIPPLPLRHLSRLPGSLQASHRRWLAEQRLPEAGADASTGPAAGRRSGRLRGTTGDQSSGNWPVALPSGRGLPGRRGGLPRSPPAQPGSSSWPAGVSPQ